MANCNCESCLLFNERQFCSLCNRDTKQIEDAGQFVGYYGNRELERDDLTCHCYFCEGCRYWMHIYKIKTCRKCETDISQIIESSCPHSLPNSFSCNCDVEDESYSEEDESYSEEEESEEEPKNLT